MNIPVLLAVALGLVAVQVGLARYVKLNRLAWMAVWWVATYLAVRYGFEPPLPSSIVVLFMAVVTLSLAAYLSADSDELADAKDVTVRFMVEHKYRNWLLAVTVAIPALVAFRVYADMTAPPQPPSSGRTIHPPPPASISFGTSILQLATADSPYRELKHSDPAAFAEHVANGRRVYFENCLWCHGDNMQGAGMFAHGYDPIPANFNDPTTIAMLQESYLFWRVAKGAPGLPSESTPWSSAMPAWEQFLSEEEIWDVIIFLYEYTGYEPRAPGMPH